MQPIRNRKTPRRRLVAWVAPETYERLTTKAERAGLSLGQLLDRQDDSATGPKAPQPALPVDPVFVQHKPESKGWGIVCSVCGAVKGGNVAWRGSCTGPK